MFHGRDWEWGVKNVLIHFYSHINLIKNREWSSVCRFLVNIPYRSTSDYFQKKRFSFHHFNEFQLLLFFHINFSFFLLSPFPFWSHINLNLIYKPTILIGTERLSCSWALGRVFLYSLPLGCSFCLCEYIYLFQNNFNIHNFRNFVFVS